MPTETNVSEEQLLEGARIVKEMLPRLLSDAPEITEFDRTFADGLADKLVGLKWREVAQIAGFAQWRAYEARAALIVVLQILKYSSGANASLIDIQNIVLAHRESEIDRMADDVRRRAKAAANALHDLPGGSREKQRKIREAWASGRYTSRDRCAEEECGALGMSFAAARKALRNTPKPT